MPSVTFPEAIPSISKTPIIDLSFLDSDDDKDPLIMHRGLYDLKMEYSSGSLGMMVQAVWEANFKTKVSDIPRLMRQGFHWSHVNVREKKGYMLARGGGSDGYLRPTEFDVNWTYYRSYDLVDIRDEPQWDAVLTVGAHDVQLFSWFRVEHLSFTNLLNCVAWNWPIGVIYHYDHRCRDKSFNKFYDDMTLEGWWPWPKEEEEEEAEDAVQNWQRDPKTSGLGRKRLRQLVQEELGLVAEREMGIIQELEDLKYTLVERLEYLEYGRYKLLYKLELLDEGERQEHQEQQEQ